VHIPKSNLEVWAILATKRETGCFGRGIQTQSARDAKYNFGRLIDTARAAALGTTSSDFVNATLTQIQNASRMPSGGISETSVNAVLAFIEGAEPKNEIEAALAIQMACTHGRHGSLE
jgi:hypothetical protein